MTTKVLAAIGRTGGGFALDGIPMNYQGGDEFTSDIRGSFYDGQSWIDAEILGDELITNGDFTNWTSDDPDGWTVGYEDANNYVTESVAGGQCRIVSDDSAAIQIYQNIISAGSIYKVDVDIVSVTSGGIRLHVPYYAGSTTYVDLTSVGHYSFYFSPSNSGNLTIVRIPGSSCDITIDNVSVKEVTTKISDYADTGAVVVVEDTSGNKAIGYIGDDEGTGETLGSELFTNNTFDSDTDWTKGAGWTIASGVASHDETLGAGNLTQSISITLYKQYRWDYEIATTDSGIVYLLSGNSPSSTYYEVSPDIGFHTYYLTRGYPDTIDSFGFRGSSQFTGDIDNLYVKEVTEPNITAVHVYQDSALENEGWESIDDNFNPNQIASVLLLKAGYEDAPVIGRGNELCIVQYTDSYDLDLYWYDKDGFGEENDPSVIVPDSNTEGIGAWQRAVMQNGYGGMFAGAHFVCKYDPGSDYAATAGAWTTMPLNHEILNQMEDYCTFDDSTYTIGLYSGDYLIRAWIAGYGFNGGKAALYTGSAALGRANGLINLTTYGSGAANETVYLEVIGRITVSSYTEYTLRYYVANAASDFGKAADLDNLDEIYASLRVWRIG